MKNKMYWFDDGKDLEVMWKEYALADDKDLTEDARRLKQALLEFARNRKKEVFAGLEKNGIIYVDIFDKRVRYEDTLKFQLYDTFKKSQLGD